MAVPSVVGADANEPETVRPEGVQTSAKRGPGRPRKQTSKYTNLAPDQGNVVTYDSDAERVAEAISLSLSDAQAGEAAASRKRLDFSSPRSRGSINMRTTRSQSAERERRTRGDDFVASAADSTAEAEAPRGEAQRSRIEFDDEAVDDTVIASAPLSFVLAAAELDIREQVNKKVTEARARCPHP